MAKSSNNAQFNAILNQNQGPVQTLREAVNPDNYKPVEEIANPLLDITSPNLVISNNADIDKAWGQLMDLPDETKQQVQTQIDSCHYLLNATKKFINTSQYSDKSYAESKLDLFERVIQKGMEVYKRNFHEDYRAPAKIQNNHRGNLKPVKKSAKKSGCVIL